MAELGEVNLSHFPVSVAYNDAIGSRIADNRSGKFVTPAFTCKRHDRFLGVKSEYVLRSKWDLRGSTGRLYHDRKRKQTAEIRQSQTR